MSAEGVPTWSVIVATRNRPDSLYRCISSILASTASNIEVVVVDQSEPPAELPDDPRIRHVVTSTIGKSTALNIGLNHARGALLAFTDDDCTVPPDWLEQAEHVLEGLPDVGIVFGELRAIVHDHAEYFVPTNHFDRLRVIHRPSHAYVRGGAGADLIARATVFDRVGGWDETIGPGARFRACEEWDLHFRTLAAGVPVAMTPDIGVLHWGLRAYSDGSGRSLLRDYAYGEGAVMGKHLRFGNRSMIPPMLHIFGDDITRILESLRHRRLSGLGSLAWKWRGILAGLVHPSDRGSGVFVTSHR